MRPVSLLSVYKTVRHPKAPLQTLKSVAVRDGQAVVTDLNTYAVIPTDLPDGVYRLVRTDFEKYPEGAGPSLNDMPPAPKMQGAVITSPIVFPRRELQNVLRFTVPDPPRPLWDAVCLRVRTDRTMEIIVTDQFAMCRHVVHAPRAFPEGEYIVPAKAIRTLLLDKDAEEVSLAVVTATLYGSYISMSTGRLQVIARLIDEKYYETDHTIPKALSATFAIDAKEFREAIRTLAPYVDPSEQSVRIRDGVDVASAINASPPAPQWGLLSRNLGKCLEKEVFIDVEDALNGKLTGRNIMLVMPMSPPKSSRSDSDGRLYLQHRYLTQVADSVPGPTLYMGLQQGNLGDLSAVVFSPGPLCGGDQA